jgi:capsular polysaccharide biosynthesis protein
VHSEAPPTVSLRLDQAMAALRRRWPTALLVLGAWLGLGAAAAAFAPVEYTATAAVTVDSLTNAAARTPTATTPDMPTEEQSVTSTAVLERVAGELGVSAPEVDRSISVANPDRSRVLTISYRAATAAQAARGANAVAADYLDVRRSAARAQARAEVSALQERARQLRAQAPKTAGEPSALATAYGQQIADVQTRLADLALVSEATGGKVSAQASPPSSPSGPSAPVYLAGGLVLGSACAVVAALLRDKMSRRVQDPRLLSSRIDAPVILAAATSSTDQVIRTLVLRFDLAASRAPRSIAVVGTPSTGLATALTAQLRRQGLRARLADASSVGVRKVDRGWPSAPDDRVLVVDVADAMDNVLAATVASRCELVFLAVTTGSSTTRISAFLDLLHAAGREVDGAVLLHPRHPLGTPWVAGPAEPEDAQPEEPARSDGQDQAGAARAGRAARTLGLAGA